jgi:hypothetical protein
MSALDLHNEAMEKTFLAQEAKLRNDFLEYLNLSREAFNLEREASMMLKDNTDSEPTRSVLFRSAATLALNCGEYDEAVRLISFALIGRPHHEIREELLDVLSSVSKELESSSEQQKDSNAYLDFLREKAINIKIDPKVKLYSQAIALDAIVETLRNFRTSLTNYVEINFRKHFSESDFQDYNHVLATIKKDYNPLCVNLSFRSFSASICVDDKVTFKEYNPRVLEWKGNLFSSYKEEVIDVEYESENSLKGIVEKYSAEERDLIYSPILDSIKDRNVYKVSITDRGFRNVIKTFRPVSRTVHDILVPKIKKYKGEKEKVLVQSYALSDDPRNLHKKDIFESTEIEYAEFTKNISEVSLDRDYLVVKNPFDIKIIYKKPDFSIEDHFFGIYTRADTYQDVLKSYLKILIELYKRFSGQNEENLSVDEIQIKSRLSEAFAIGT